MTKRKACFICGTPFHVISSIILKYQLDIDSDIIIFDQFPNTDKLKQNLLKEGVFTDVTILNRKKTYRLPESLLMNYVYALWGYFNVKKIGFKTLPEVEKYSDVFFANAQCVDTIDRFNYCYIKKYYPQINLHYMEDGWLCCDEDFYKLTKLDYLFRKYVVRGGTHVLDMKIHLYSLELYNAINEKKRLNVVQINKPNSFVTEKLKKVFSYIKLEDLSQYEIIVFDTVRKEEFSKEGSIKYNSIVKKLVGEKSVIVKSHPREKERFFEYDYFETNGFPFEILCLYNNFDNSIFINNDSSAVFTPKVLFDQEPRVYFTFKALDKYMHHSTDVNEYRILSKFRDLYRDKSKIVILEDTK